MRRAVKRGARKSFDFTLDYIIPNRAVNARANFAVKIAIYEYCNLYVAISIIISLFIYIPIYKEKQSRAV